MTRDHGPWLFRWSAILLVMILCPVSAFAIPAFARKYQLRCTACHEAWPILSQFGRAFRDNGYQLELGKDHPVTTPPGYWPVAIRFTPAYERDSVNHQPTDSGEQTLRSGGSFGVGGFDLLAAGTLGHNVSFLFVPTYASDEGMSIESAWVRFDNLANSTWLNIKLGHHEMDLPRSAHRPINMTTGYLIYGYHPLGSDSGFDMGGNQDGVEWVGHDRGSLNRIAVSLFNVDGSPGSKGVWNTPGIYVHATHEFLFDSYGVSGARLGFFAADAAWPTTFATIDGEPVEGTGTDLKHSTRYGIEGHVLFGPSTTPFHAILTLARGSDDQALIPDATRDGTWSGGFLELDWTPTIKTTPFFRYDWIRNNDQPFDDTPSNANDQTQYTIGIRHTIAYSTRSEYALHAEYSALKLKGAFAGDPTVTASSVFLGVDLAF